MKTICTKCGSDEIYEVPRAVLKEPDTQTLDEFVYKLNGATNAVYYPTTWACKKCGYSVTR